MIWPKPTAMNNPYNGDDVILNRISEDERRFCDDFFEGTCHRARSPQRKVSQGINRIIYAGSDKLSRVPILCRNVSNGLLEIGKSVL